MSGKYLVLAILISSPFILMIFHIIFLKTLKFINMNVSPQLILFLIIILFNVPVLLSTYFLTKKIDIIIYSFIVYNCIGYCYFHIFNMSETARRIKILIEIMQKGALSAEDLKLSYNTDLMIKYRLERLIGLKQIIKTNDNKYILSGKILLIGALFMYAWRKILGFNDK